MRKLLAIGALFAVGGCTPYFYEGQLATLEPADDLKILQTEQSYGDCYRLVGSVPTVYEVERPQYTVIMAHGDRYWPEIYLNAVSVVGERLSLEGRKIAPVPQMYKYGTDHMHLEELRNTPLWYASGKLSGTTGSIEFLVKNASGIVLGHEAFEYTVEEIACFGWDAI